MNYTKPSEETLEIIKQIIDITPRTGLEVLLVKTTVKTGDAIDKEERNSDYIINSIKELRIKNIDKEEVFYYHNGRVPEKITNILKDDNESIKSKIEIKLGGIKIKNMSEVMGVFYGYPNCCIKAYQKNEHIKEFMPGTEHLWCKKNCEESLKLQKTYIRVVNELLPKYKNLILKFGELSTSHN